MEHISAKEKSHSFQTELIHLLNIMPTIDNEQDTYVRDLYLETIKTISEQRPSTVIYQNQPVMKMLENLFIFFMRDKHVLDLMLRIYRYDRTTFIHSVDVFVLGTIFSCFFDTKTLDFSKACLLHDAGKLNVPLYILNKKETLSNEEYRIIQTHPIHSYDFIHPFENDYICNIVFSHHEKADGSGYPRGINIHDSSFHFDYLLIYLMDEFSAMTLPRSYKDGFTVEKTLKIHHHNLFKQLNHLETVFHTPLSVITATQSEMIDFQNAFIGEKFIKLANSLLQKKNSLNMNLTD